MQSISETKNARGEKRDTRNETKYFSFFFLPEKIERKERKGVLCVRRNGDARRKLKQCWVA